MSAPERRSPQAGFGAADALVGLLVAMLALAAVLAGARGVLRLGQVIARRADHEAGAAWAVERIAREIARAGVGVCPQGPCPDEALEFVAAHAIAVRGDLDGDDRAAAAWPEAALDPAGAPVPTANDEIVVFLLRGAGHVESVTFEADVDSVDRVAGPGATLLARRDGVAEPVDAGPAATGDTPGGTLYRVSFSNDARDRGTARFDSAQPLADGVRAFRVRAVDAAGNPRACGGSDTPAARACRAAVRLVEVELEVDPGPSAAWSAAAPRRVTRAVALAEGAGR